MKHSSDTMKKTPVATRFINQIDKVNDQVCFSALRQWEFEKALSPLVKARSSEFTTMVFSENPFANKIYRRIDDLPAFSQESDQVALRMGVIAGVEHCLAYIEEIQAFRHSLKNDDGDTIKNDAQEEQLRLKIEKWAGK